MVMTNVLLAVVNLIVTMKKRMETVNKAFKILFLPIIVVFWIIGWTLIVVGERSNNQKKKEAKLNIVRSR
jgi:glucose-6-phosphate-specific signal transduction histidine kinase